MGDPTNTHQPTMNPLTFQTLAPTAKHTATVIFSHGLGDQGASWIPVAQVLCKHLPYVRWIFPNAPEIPITLNNGYRMPGWFDLSSLDKLGDVASEDAVGLWNSTDAIQTLISREGLSVDDKRVVVGGFSQGCVVSLLAGLTKGTQGKEREVERALGGVIGQSFACLCFLAGQLKMGCFDRSFRLVASARSVE